MNITTRKSLARSAAKAASRLRSQLRKSLEPIDPIGLAEELGILVRILDAPSLNGMYVNSERPTIILSSLRPQGRRAYTCAHEIGHHIFNHGTKVDEYLNGELRQEHENEEFLADTFAGMLLMPSLTIMQAFKSRGWNFKLPTPLQSYIVSQALGVSYSGLVTHMASGLELFPFEYARRLKRVQPRQISAEIAGLKLERRLTIIDQHWSSLPVDLEVGEYIMLPDTLRCRDAFSKEISSVSPLLRKVLKVGIFSASVGAKLMIFRVSRRAFSGLARYRYLGDEE